MTPFFFRLAFLAILLAPTPAAAQITGILAGLFDSVNSIAFSTSGGGFLDGEVEATCGATGLCGFQIEVLLDLPAPEGTTFELGLGTGVLRGIGLVEPSLDFRGSVRTLPSFGVYASSDRLPAGTVVTPYGGLRIGFAQLWSTRGYDPAGVPFTLGGEALEYGALAGLSLRRTALRGLYVEAGYHRRPFDGLAWGLPTGSALPEGWPRDLDLSSWELTLGWQFRLTREE